MSSAEGSTGIWKDEVSEEGDWRGVGVNTLKDTRMTHEPEMECGRQGPGWRETWEAWHMDGI